MYTYIYTHTQIFSLSLSLLFNSSLPVSGVFLNSKTVVERLPLTVTRPYFYSEKKRNKN